LQIAGLGGDAQHFTSVTAAHQFLNLPDPFPSVNRFCHEVDYTMDGDMVMMSR
jgi:hypothetical protein